jgi:hypothetical protein
MDILTSNAGGVYLWVWLLVFPVLFVIYYLGDDWWQTRQARKKSEGNILCLMHTVAGDAYWKWCKDDKGELSPADMKGYDAKAKALSKEAIGKIKAAKQAFGWYFVLPDHVFNIGYPFNKPRINVKIASYVENYPAPRTTANLEKWSPTEYKNVTSSLAIASKDTTDIEAIITQAAGLEEKLGSLVGLPDSVRMLKYICFALAAGVAITLFMVVGVQSKLDKIAAAQGITMLFYLVGV